MSARAARPRAARRTLLVGLAMVVALGAPTAAAAAPPALSAPQAILVEDSTGEVVFSRQARVRRAVASTTKLMTALVVLERVSLDDTFTAGTYRGISPAETKLGLRPGESMSVRDLLRGLLLASANDAAQVLAEGTAGSTEAFVALMNQRARQLGLRDTRYANPIGLDEPGNHSSAADLVALTRRLRRNRFFAATVAMPRARLSTGRRPRVVENRNRLVERHPWVTGVKTGHTVGAGYVLVGSASRRGVSVVSAVLGDPSEQARDADTAALLNWGLRQFRSVTLLAAGRQVASSAVRHRDEQRIGLRPARAVVRVVRRGRRASVRLVVPSRLEGPLPAGAPAGTAVVGVGGRVVERIPLLTMAPVPTVGLVERVLDPLLRPGTLAVLALLAGLVLLVAGRRRRGRSGHRKAPSA